MIAPPTERVRELETLLARIRHAGMVQLNYDMWEQHGAAHASAEQRATMEADLAEASRARAAAIAALEALVAATRADELAAWADAHDAYLAAFLDDGPDETAADVARRERAAWAEVRAGTRAFVDENLFYVTEHAERYRRCFGIDPQTLERVD
jgi:cytidylate kinase